MELKKYPSVSETLDWARALVMLNAKSIDEKILDNTLTILLKYEQDVQRARRVLGEFKGDMDQDDDEPRGNLTRFNPRRGR
jgi:hypothetical protein